MSPQAAAGRHKLSPGARGDGCRSARSDDETRYQRRVLENFLTQRAIQTLIFNFKESRDHVSAGWVERFANHTGPARSVPEIDRDQVSLSRERESERGSLCVCVCVCHEIHLLRESHRLHAKYSLGMMMEAETTLFGEPPFQKIKRQKACVLWRKKVWRCTTGRAG